MTRVWIDVDNPAQAQYLPPFRAAFERAGADVLLTARDNGATLELLDQHGVPYVAVGAAFGPGRRRKALGVLGRARALSRPVRRARPALLLSSSRSSALLARRLRVPAFVVCDYEHVDLRLYRLAGAHIVHPAAIGPEVFVAKGFRPERLHAFDGLKEDISLGGLDVDAVAAYEPPVEAGLATVLVRPPAEESHYVQPVARTLTLRLLERLARRDDAAVVFSPRYPGQRGYLDEYAWRRPPVLLERPVPFVPLLKGIDLVVTSGGTMAREAAWLGTPAVSILPYELDRVDSHLAALGRLTIVRGEDDLDAVEPRAPRRERLPSRPELVDELARRLLSIASGVR